MGTLALSTTDEICIRPTACIVPGFHMTSAHYTVAISNLVLYFWSGTVSGIIIITLGNEIHHQKINNLSPKSPEKIRKNVGVQ